MPLDQERDLILNPLSEPEIRHLAGLAGGVERILSTKSPKYAQYKDRVTNPDDWIAFMVEEPRLLKRPIVNRDGTVYVGFDAKAWQALAMPAP